ncbi:MAG TPA: hypothetical protein VJT81_18890 [Burkholderiales bacterium]|nr:hypothetical protein [Burkholderiales bacterium]
MSFFQSPRGVLCKTVCDRVGTDCGSNCITEENRDIAGRIRTLRGETVAKFIDAGDIFSQEHGFSLQLVVLMLCRRIFYRAL